MPTRDRDIDLVKQAHRLLDKIDPGYEQYPYGSTERAALANAALALTTLVVTIREGRGRKPLPKPHI